MLIVINAISTMINKLPMILVAFIFISMVSLKQHINTSTNQHKGQLLFFLITLTSIAYAGQTCAGMGKVVFDNFNSPT